jgi:type IV secretory pathway VirB2 component (pilin)
MMLTGSINVRRSVQVILGCFVIFGASTIANGLVAAMSLPGSSDNPLEQQVLTAGPSR